MHTDEHETAWHVIQNPYPAWREAKAILICPAWAGLRKEASQEPRRREHSSNIDLSVKETNHYHCREGKSNGPTRSNYDATDRDRALSIRYLLTQGYQLNTQRRLDFGNLPDL